MIIYPGICSVIMLVIIIGVSCIIISYYCCKKKTADSNDIESDHETPDSIPVYEEVMPCTMKELEFETNVNKSYGYITGTHNIMTQCPAYQSHHLRM